MSAFKQGLDEAQVVEFAQNAERGHLESAFTEQCVLVNEQGEQIKVQGEQIVSLKATVDQLKQRISELEVQIGSGGPPPFVKKGVPPRPKQKRKNRACHFHRLPDEPTDRVIHVPETCPDCGRKLCKGTVHRVRTVIDIVPTPVSITEHVIVGRWCGACRRRVLPKVDLSAAVVGKHRVGNNLMSWISYLHIVGRVPLRTIKRLLRLMFNLDIALGELSEVLHTVARCGKDIAARLIKEVRGSPYVHADETGWRENGQNGYMWSFSTPNTRYYLYNKSRAGEVAEKALGADFSNVLISDFYGGYNRFGCPKQRCWVHFLRDLHKLREAAGACVEHWIDAVEAVYQRGREYQQCCRSGKTHGYQHFDQKRMRQQLEKEILALAQPYADANSDAPQRVLAKRIVNFANELFTFVDHPNVPSENNPAERSIRPAVIGRKISGGTRSPKGSETKMILMSLFGTWAQQGLNPIEEASSMLATTA